MLSLTNMGLGNLRPYFILAILSTIFTFASTSNLQAQVDISIDVIEMPLSQGEGNITIAPNPVSSYTRVEHANGLTLQSVTILDQNGDTLAVIDLSQTSSFEVSLPSGLTIWNFQTSSGLISKQVVILGS